MAKQRQGLILPSQVKEEQHAANGMGRGKLQLQLLLLVLLMNTSCVACARDHRKQTNLEAKVGSHVVFNCYIDFPYDSPIPYVVHWSKDVSQVLNASEYCAYDALVSVKLPRHTHFTS